MNYQSLIYLASCHQEHEEFPVQTNGCPGRDAANAMMGEITKTKTRYKKNNWKRCMIKLLSVKDACSIIR